MPMKRIRILSGRPAMVELELDMLLDEYAVAVWAITEAADGVTVTAVLVSQAEMRKAALLNQQMAPRRM
jgi:hypothetical protein